MPHAGGGKLIYEPYRLYACHNDPNSTQKYHDLIASYVQQETPGHTQLSSIDSFNQSVTELGEHAQSRYDAVLTYLSGK